METREGGILLAGVLFAGIFFAGMRFLSKQPIAAGAAL